ncbi:MAG: hypothetical protein JWP69_938 [Flaviaesturariibacter sp.]|nr:hypothetical protein [Flaviaesturariibacter sp.]
MKPLFYYLITFLLFTLPVSAQNRKTFKINPGQTIKEAIPVEEALSSPEFVEGVIQFRNGAYANARLVYNYLIPGMQFINEKGDTLTLDNEPEVKYAVLQKDTFYYDKGYYKALASFDDQILAEKRYFTFSNRERIGAMGVPTSSSIDTYSNVSSTTYYANLVAKEIITLSKYKYLYIGDRFNHFTIVNKKGLMEVFPGKEKAILDYIRDNKVDYSDADAIKKLLLHFKKAK